VHESSEHQRAKELIAAELARRLAAGLAMPWVFKDTDASDYPLEGNLLLGADQVVTEHPLDTPFGCRYRLDIAVLGTPIQTEPMRDAIQRGVRHTLVAVIARGQQVLRATGAVRSAIMMSSTCCDR